MRLPITIALAIALAQASIACGSATPAPTAPTDPNTSSDASKDTKKDGPAIIYDLGDVAPNVARRNFDELQSKWTACYDKGHSANAALAGTLKFDLRTNHDGSVKWVFVKESDLGDREVERCILDSVREANWGEPVDAKEGEIRGKTVGWENDEDEAVEVDEARVRPAVEKARAKIDACRERAGAKGTIRATFYVAAKGKPLSIGLAVADASGEAAADCIHDVLMGLTFVNPSQQITKTTMELP